MTDFDLATAVPVLARTPHVMSAFLADLPDEWIFCNDGPDTWSPFDILGHLIHGERIDWIPRARMILEHGTSAAFEPFDRFAQFRESLGKSLAQLLGEFKQLREANLRELQALGLTASEMGRRGVHPEFGEVTMGELLATWVVHDLSHLAQVAEVMSRQYRRAVGPWRAYLPILGAG